MPTATPPFSLLSLFKPSARIGIVDIGASFVDGSTPVYQPLLQNGAARLVGFEPNEEECSKLRAMFGEPHRFYPYFIGDGQPAVFHETNWFATGSLFAPNKALLEKFQVLHEITTLVAEHAIQTRRLDDIPDLGDVDFIKLDVQGAELMVLRGAERTLKGAVMVWVEVEFVELYENQPLFAEVDQYLRSQDFMFHTFRGFGTRCVKPMVRNKEPHVGINQYLWSDAVYVRNWLDPAAIPVEKLAGFALLLNDLVGSLDLAHHALERLDAATGSNHAPAYRNRLMGQ